MSPTALPQLSRRELSQKIDFTRMFMILGVVVLHVPPVWNFGQPVGSPENFLRVFLQHSIFMLSAPMLSAISGYFLFSSHWIPHRYLSELRGICRC